MLLKQNLNTQKLILAGNPELQDRLEIFSSPARTIVALADGAGGISGGAEAAEALIRLAGENQASLFSAAGFSVEARQGVILIASDGLWKYTSQEKITVELQHTDRSNLLERLGNLVRLRSGALQDDMAVAALNLG